LKSVSDLSSASHNPERSGLPSDVRGAGADKFGRPSDVRGIPGVGWFNHWLNPVDGQKSRIVAVRAVASVCVEGTDMSSLAFRGRLVGGGPSLR
jgi:hypothetical protein